MSNDQSFRNACRDLNQALYQSHMNDLGPLLRTDPEKNRDAIFREYLNLKEAVLTFGEEIGESAEMGTFFDSVSDSMISAQQELDARSQDYIDQVRSKPGLTPTVFRIPSLEAELRFAFESVSAKKSSVIFYSKKSEQRDLIEQKVNFKIVAAPPTPELVASLGELMWLPVVLDSETRQRVRNALDDNTLPEGSVKKQELLQQWPRALVLETTVEDQYLVLLAEAGDDETRLGIWNISPAAGTGKSVQVILRWRGARIGQEGVTTRPLRNFLASRGDEQEKWLRSGPANQ